jgi:predicted  nucleic acid-binding Zn-ribbon protein
MEVKQDTVRLVTRLPASLHRRLQEQAREHHRSLNSEIIDILGGERTEDQQIKDLRDKIERLEEDVKTSRPTKLRPLLEFLREVSQEAERQGKPMAQHFEEVVVDMLEKAYLRQKAAGVVPSRRELGLEDEE